MNAFLLYSKVGSVTGRALREALKIDGGVECRRPAKYDTLIRWGSSAQPDLDASMATVVNKAASIGRIANRQYMMADLRRASDHALEHCANLPAHNGLGDKVILRHRFGKWGRDIILTDNTSDAWHNLLANRASLDGYFAVQYWPADYEVRVHVFKDKSISMQYKRAREGVTPTERGGVTVRNYDSGWGLYPLSEDEARTLRIQRRPLRDHAKHVAAELGMDFLVVDFLVRTVGGAHAITSYQQFKVLEVNTAPGCEGTTLEAYKRHFRAFLDERDESEETITDTPPPIEATPGLGASAGTTRTADRTHLIVRDGQYEWVGDEEYSAFTQAVLERMMRRQTRNW